MEILGLIELINPVPTDELKLEGDFWTFFDIAQYVEDINDAFAFYQDAMGLECIADYKFPSGVMDDFLHLPKGSEFRLVAFNYPQYKGPQVEILWTSAKGKIIAASPQEMGIFMTSFQSDNLDEDISAVKKKGFEVISGPLQIETPLHGKVRAVDIEGPSKARVEFFQKV